MNNVLRATIAGAGLLAAPLPLQAHGFHEPVGGLMTGILHPFSGWDHVLLALTAGIFLSSLSGRTALRGALGFLVFGMVGWALGKTAQSPGDLFALATAMVVGLMLVANRAFVGAMPFVALLALGAGHGWVHAQVLASGNMATSAGLAAATGILAAAGFFAGRFALQRRWTPAFRALGVVLVTLSLLNPLL